MAGLDASIGLSALLAAQRGLEVVGHNVANASTPGYTRQVAELREARPESRLRAGQVGTGVEVISVARVADLFLEGRLREAAATYGSDSAAAGRLGEVEAIVGSTSEAGIGPLLGRFFASAQALAARPDDTATRTSFVASARLLAQGLRSTFAALEATRTDIGREIAGKVDEANGLLDQVAALNQAIVAAKTRGEAPNDLLDQRDGAVKDLSRLLGVRVTEQPNGAVTLALGNRLLVSGDRVNHLETVADPVAGALVRDTATHDPVSPTSGEVAGLQAVARDHVTKLEGQLDQLARAVMFETNRIQATGLPLTGPYTALTTTVPASSASTPLAQAGLDFVPAAGTIVVNVTDLATGARTSTNVAFDPTRQSLTDLATALSAVPNLSAVAQPDGRLRLSAAAGLGFDFADPAGGDASDKGGVLAALGASPVFTGSGASDIAVAAGLETNLGALAAGVAPGAGDGRGVARLAALDRAALPSLGGASATGFFSGLVATAGNGARAARSLAETSESVQNDLETRRQAVSGVSVEEEVASLMRFQKMFQSAAHYLRVVDELSQELMRLAGG